MKLMKSIDNIY